VQNHTLLIFTHSLKAGATSALLFIADAGHSETLGLVVRGDFGGVRTNARRIICIREIKMKIYATLIVQHHDLGRVTRVDTLTNLTASITTSDQRCRLQYFVASCLPHLMLSKHNLASLALAFWSWFCQARPLWQVQLFTLTLPPPFSRQAITLLDSRLFFLLALVKPYF